MLLILEGIDKCGKTTFANRFKDAIIKHSTKDDDAVKVLEEYAKLSTEKLVILDRSFLSEMCYGPVYRGEMNITPAKMMKIIRTLNKIDYAILYFSRPAGTKNYDTNDEFESEPEKLELVEFRYKQYIAQYKNRLNIYEIQYK